MVTTYSILSIAALTSVVAAGTLNIPFKGTRTNVARFDRHEALVKRMSGMPLENMLIYYEATLEIGTPAQTLTFTIDTGSSDLWVMDSTNPYCGTTATELKNGYINCTGRIYDSSSSSSFVADESAIFNIEYYDNSFANGYYVTDTVSINGESIDNGIFALATECNTTVTVFGIAPVAGEASVTGHSTDGSPIGSYNNIPIMLKQQGIIDAAAYSIWLNDLNSAEGQVLFGGIDHAKYVGNLQLVPMVSGLLISDAQEAANPGIRKTIQSQQPYQPFVMLHGIYAYNSKGLAGKVADIALPALLDTGTSFSVMPADIIEAIAGTIGAEYSDAAEAYLSYCNIAGGLALDFSGATITVPYSEFLLPVYDTDTGSAVTTSDGRAVCQLPITAGEGAPILGDVFLRSMYCAFDNENFQVAIANTRFNTTDTNIESISSGIPSATKAASFSSTSSKNTYTAYVLSSKDYTKTLALVTASNAGTATAHRSVETQTGAKVSGSAVTGGLSSVGSAGAGSVGGATTSTRNAGSGSTVRTATTSPTASVTTQVRVTAGTTTAATAGTQVITTHSVSSSTASGNSGLAISVGGLMALPLALLLI